MLIDKHLYENLGYIKTKFIDFNCSNCKALVQFEEISIRQAIKQLVDKGWGFTRRYDGINHCLAELILDCPKCHLRNIINSYRERLGQILDLQEVNLPEDIEKIRAEIVCIDHKLEGLLNNIKEN